MDIRDLDNNLEMRFRYVGFGPGEGSPGIDEGSDWLSFKTNLAIRLTNFAGFARHTNAQVQLIAGPSIDIVHLLGPWNSVGADTVYLEYVELNESGLNFGVNVGTSIGTLEPLGPATPF